jgi:hypothetical protein
VPYSGDRWKRPSTRSRGGICCGTPMWNLEVKHRGETCIQRSHEIFLFQGGFVARFFTPWKDGEDMTPVLTSSGRGVWQRARCPPHPSVLRTKTRGKSSMSSEEMSSEEIKVVVQILLSIFQLLSHTHCSRLLCTFSHKFESRSFFLTLLVVGLRPRTKDLLHL